MKTQIDRARRGAIVAAFFVPSLGVVAARLFGMGPSTAAASTSPEPMAALPDIRLVPAVTDSGSGEMAELASPFWHAFQIPNAPAEATPTRRPAQLTEQPDPDFLVTAVMPHPSRPLAVINGRPRSIGDVVVPGWTLTAIDGHSRTVTLTHTSGRTQTLQIGTTPS